MSQEVIVKTNLFESDPFVDIVFDKMNYIDELKNRLPKESKEIKFADKSLFKRVLYDITDIFYTGSTLNVRFGRGVEMHIESAAQNIESYNNRIGQVYYRSLKVLEELVNLGELTLRTSPFTVYLSKSELKSDYDRSLDQILFRSDTAINSHDNGLNCWGG